MGRTTSGIHFFEPVSCCTKGQRSWIQTFFFSGTSLRICISLEFGRIAEHIDMDLGSSVGRLSNWTVFVATLGMYDHDGICIAAHDRHRQRRSLT